jgi:hypothetical protein
MAMAYTFKVGRPATVDEVAGAMSKADATHRMAEKGGSWFDPAGVHLLSGAFVSNDVSSPLPFLDPVEEVFGFAPAVTVRFRLDMGSDRQRQKQDFVRLVAAVLTSVEGDAVFVFEGEHVRLVRIAGLLTVNSAKDFWTPDLIALLPPHKLAELEGL